MRQEGDGTKDIDEIADYVSGRYLSAAECAWRVFGFRCHSRDPTVLALPVHLPGDDSVMFENGDAVASLDTVSVLERYFARPREKCFDGILYEEYCRDYKTTTKEPSGKRGAAWWFDEHEAHPRSAAAGSALGQRFPSLFTVQLQRFCIHASCPTLAARSQRSRVGTSRG